MINLKKALVLSVALISTLGLAACGETGAKETSAEKKYSIGIVQPVEHLALDDARKGFVAALKDKGYDENVTYDMQNAQGDTNNLSTICDRFVNNKVDLVLAIATDSAQSMASKTTEIPIVATAVTSFSVAGLVDSEESPGGNVTGTSDMNPVAEQVKLIKELVPEAETIGLIYNNGEDNSVLQAGIAKEAIDSMGLNWVEVTVLNSSDISQALQSLVAKCDAIYIPTDNTLASAMATVYSVTIESGTPTICGADSMVADGGLATMGINYYDLGYQAGEMAVEILEGKNPAEMPVQYAANSDIISINGEVAAAIGYEIPEEYKQYIID
ncbi:ABC transporter substrate-binding protein [Tyzzerella sp. OttesenSCG-928-J15]|nr:ABC transporter substrate-binding protein [Tyzzerella sp. OttesenSCG-928-J15]